MRSLLGVPVSARGRSIGRLYLTNKQPAGDFTEDDERLVEMFALHAGIAIENARLHEQVQRLAIVEERERIGRDLHDGIIQSIYAVGLSLEDVPDLMGDEPDEARQRVERAIDSLDQSIRDIRNFIFGLRPELLEQAGLIGGLAALADEFRVNSMIDVDVETAGIEESGPAARPDDTPALDRARGPEQHRPPLEGHPRARSWWPPRATLIRLVISDNGVGFDPDRQRAPAHQGLINMRDRVAAMGGTHATRSASPAPARVSSSRWHGAPTIMPPGPGARTRMTDPIEPRQLRLLVVDDHELVRQGLDRPAGSPRALPGRRRSGHRGRGRGDGPQVRAGPGRHGRSPAGRLRDRGLPRDPSRVPRTPASSS